MLTNESITKDQVIIGRLKRKIAKLLQQRDNATEKLSHYQHVLSMQPHLERRYNSYTDMKKEIERVKSLEARVKEQAALIKILTEKKE